MPQTVVLLYPSDIPDLGLDFPRYGIVSSRGRAMKTVRGLPRADDGEEVTTSVAPATVTSRQVPEDELTNERPGLALFRPGTVISNDTTHHGQVTAYNNGVYEFLTSSGPLEVPYDEFQEVAPAIAIFIVASRPSAGNRLAI
ncbi:hypothetical protein F441_10380 [Phytophthora nicotianae CJ01A1]|uniref:Uncharacterized protein n=3 Tax=Phytophthora nicotianae TaxID=4792 RepID=V9F1F3_PHYNI|nr:hypothetical protein F443_10439 [Phytophthora nicotianae P1569]ETK84877.1 hypothetical protein L915_10202 [Phytophthora nicotianae]ETL91408.1 hypothetical protein L917_10042 [Phytophthora nicotianae]ETP14701.1 hypothetical protein F441_10380 [Phytophthora nicotianae CJ01A1]